jgi:hypothetical protein
MNVSERVDLVEERCRARDTACPAVDRVYRRLVVVLLAAWGLLWGYFEFRVYPGVVDAQTEVREIYKLIIEGQRVSLRE